jgi:hypothetical protein
MSDASTAILVPSSTQNRNLVGPEEVGDAVSPRQFGLVAVQVHPIDALELHGHTVSEDISGTAG